MKKDPIHKTLIIVPAYNEEFSIVCLIKEVKESYPNCDILVINDASIDNTAELAYQTKMCDVLDLPFNLGIGGAVQAGFKYAYNHNYQIAVQIDGDGQHVPAFIPRLIKLIELGKADVVIGTRFNKSVNRDGFQSTFIRRLGIRLFSYVSYMLIGQRISDCTSGFRAYNKKAILFLSNNYPTDYPEPEAVILLGKNKFILKEVHVKMRERNGGKSSITKRSVFYMIKVLLAMLMTSIRPKITKHD